MLPLLIPLLFILTINGEVHYCCIGTKIANVNTTLFSGQCPPNLRQYCVSATLLGTSVYSCASSAQLNCSIGINCCYSDNCNCPTDGTVHKTITNLNESIGDMRRIMLPLLGVLFSLLYLSVAFFNFSHLILFYIVILTDIIFGIFLIFIHTTVYLGFGYIVLGVCAFLGTKTSQFRIILVVCALALFLYTGGLTIIRIPNFPRNFIDRISSRAPNCEGLLNIINWENNYWNLDTRCENYTLFVVFCVFVLFLMQPLYILLAFMMDEEKSDDGMNEVVLEDHYVKAVD